MDLLFRLAVLSLLLSSCSEQRTGERDAGSESRSTEIQPEEPDAVAPQKSRPPPLGTKVVLLGTGTPIADPDRSGPSVAVVVDGFPYIVDFGPGVVRRAAAASHAGIEGLEVELLKRAFVTHLHSDHTAGYPDLILTPWVLGRTEPLEVWGPPGIEAMTRNIIEAYEQDIQVRSEGNQPSTDRGYEVIAHDIEPGTVHRDDRVTVKAFAVKHGAWKVAYGYRFDTKDRSVVISGDTVPVESIVESCDGCDLLVHEVYAQSGFEKRSREWQAYHSASHTSSTELAKIAARARPKLLVLYHQLLWGASREEVLADIRSGFDGEVIYGSDLDVY